MLLFRSIFLAAALMLCLSTQAHTCGVPNLEVEVGSVAIWNIEANLEEVQTLYTPVSLGDSTIAVITPGRQFLAHDAYFAIVGKKVGTTTFSYSWFYAGTGAGGICTVTVTVRPPTPYSGISSLTAMSGLPLFIYSQYLFSQRYIFTPQTLPPGAQYDPQSGTFYWIPNPLGFYAMTGLWALPSNPNQTFPLIAHLLVSSRQALRLDVDLKPSKLELCIANPLGGPITLERTMNLRDWDPVATYDSAPDREVRVPLGAVPSAIYRTRLGAPALQIGAEPEYFKFPIPENYAADSRLYWSIAADAATPTSFEGPLHPFNGRFVMPLEPQTLPNRGHIYFMIQDALRTSALMTQPFEKISGAPANTAPTITGLADTITLPRNGQPLSFRFMVMDDRTFPNLLEFHPMSMNQALVPDYLIQTSVRSDGSGTLQLSAFPNQSGTAPIHLQVFDGLAVTTKMLTVQVAANTAPNVSRISSLYTPMNIASRVVDFTVSDAETAATALTLTASSSAPNVVPQTGITLGGGGMNRTVVITPAAGATGSSTITVTVTDAEGLTDQSVFDVTVTAGMRYFYDFNLDNKSDLLLQDDTGALAAWYMNGSVRIAEAPLNPPTTGTKDWLCIGGGYFDGNRRDDLLFQNTDRTLATWHLNGINLEYGSFLTPMTSDLGWSAVAVADLNRDRSSDILFQHQDGRISGWLMDGTERRSTITFSAQPVDNTWRLVGAGDFNADAYPDFVFQKTDGNLALWYMKNSERLGEATFSPGQPEDAQERVVAVTDLNNDTKTDLLFQKPAGGAVRAWYMNGINRTLSEPLAIQPGGTWRVVAP